MENGKKRMSLKYFKNIHWSTKEFKVITIKKEKSESDRIHINGKDYYWSRKYKLEWIEEDAYLPMINQVLHEQLQEKINFYGVKVGFGFLNFLLIGYMKN